MYHFQENDETSDPRSAYLALHKISHFSKTSASFLIYSLSYANKSLCSLIFCPVSYKLMPCHSFLYVSLSFHNQTPINFQRSWKRYFSRPKKKEKEKYENTILFRYIRYIQTFSISASRYYAVQQIPDETTENTEYPIARNQENRLVDRSNREASE